MEQFFQAIEGEKLRKIMANNSLLALTTKKL